MKFSIFKTALASRGELCTYEKYLEVASSALVHEICAEISRITDKEEISQLKKRLPVITWQAYFEGKRIAKEAQPSGLFMIDIDHVENPFEVYEKKVVSKIKDLGIVFCGMTASQHGLRIVALCRAEFKSLEECQHWLAKELDVEIDSVCKDFARCSFVVTDEYTYYMDGSLFLEDPDPATLYKPQNSTNGENFCGTTKKVSPPENDEAVVDQRGGLFGAIEDYHGIPLTKIAELWLDRNGGMPEVGERNTRLYKLCLRLRYLTDFNQYALFKAIPHCGLSDEEVNTLISSACSASRGAEIPKDMLDVIDLLDRKSLLLTDDKDYDEDLSAYTEIMPPMPPVIKQFCECAPSDFKKAVALCQLPILGALGSRLRAVYIDGKVHSPSFQVSLEAPQASGKSFMKMLVDYELKQMMEHDENERAKEREYDERVKTMRLLNQKITPENKDEILGQKPRTLIRFVPATMSITKLLIRMAAAQGLHLFAISEEIDTVTKAFKRGFSSYSDLLRVSFDNSLYGQDYASENSFSGMLPIYYNFLTSGTPKAMRRFYPDVEDGLVSRVCFVTLPDQFGKPMPVWKELSADQKQKVDIGLVRLNEVSIQGDEVQPEHMMKMNFVNEELKSWLQKQQALALMEGDRTRDIFCRRSAVVGFRAGMLAWFLYGEKNTPTIRKSVVRFSLWVADCMLNQHLLRFNIENSGSNTNPWEEIYKQLGNEFTREELKTVLRRNMIQTAVKVVVYKWRLNGLIEAVEENRSESGRKQYSRFRKL